MFLLQGASFTTISTIILAFRQDIVTQLQFTCHSFLLKISHCVCQYVKPKKLYIYIFYYFLLILYGNRTTLIQFSRGKPRKQHQRKQGCQIDNLICQKIFFAKNVEFNHYNSLLVFLNNFSNPFPVFLHIWANLARLSIFAEKKLENERN